MSGDARSPSSPTRGRRRPTPRCASSLEAAAARGRGALRPRGDAQAPGSQPPRASSRTPRSSDDVDIAIALGGDGTILRALRRYAGTERPGVRRQLRRDRLPGDGRARGRARGVRACARRRVRDAARCRRSRSSTTAARLGDQRRRDPPRPGERVAELAYAIGGEEVGRVRCDGLVVATPAGSTGYNLANGGPVLAWGVEGFVVSFIAPHSLTARALVVAPGRRADGPQPLERRPSTSRSTAARRRARARARPSRSASCARRRASRCCPGASFYRRLRETFGRWLLACRLWHPARRGRAAVAILDTRARGRCALPGTDRQARARRRADARRRRPAGLRAAERVHDRGAALAGPRREDHLLERDRLTGPS